MGCMSPPDADHIEQDQDGPNRDRGVRHVERPEMRRAPVHVDEVDDVAGGGAFGNLSDRAVAGYVVDFVDVYWGATHFWAFNVADSAITIGAILVLLDMIGIGRRHASHPV